MLKIKKSHFFMTVGLICSFVFMFNFVFACDTCDDNSDSNDSSVVDSIIFSGDNANVKWTVNGYSNKGFKVVWSKNPNPTYPTRSGDKYHYHSSLNKDSDTLTAFDGNGIYYARVCEYLGGKCGVYSNEIVIELSDSSNNNKEETTTNNPVVSIKLRVEGIKIKWKTNGYSAKGFKISWSKNPNPTYPTRSGDKYHYYSSPSQSSDTLNAFNGDGIYYVRVCEYLGGVCRIYSNEVTINLQKDEEIKKIENNSKLLAENKLDDILAELKELRNLVREQQDQIKYLRSLVDDMNQITSGMRSAINNFISYGVDENTKWLGAGERAAVIYSYKSAFGRLPSTEEDLTDTIKIANGRWPSAVSEEALERAKEKFKVIYLREADTNNFKDDAAVTIMAYGLRQRSENRNLNSERNGLKIFQSIFGHLPETTEDWNALQSITYSGSTR
ncbi:MAG: hypothetical protein U9O55_04070 [Patescibacteria group bacterium]|nr:hypothetical protein [Patescibacteria group bacterium]